MRVDGQGPEAYSSIYHEYFHILVNLNAPGLPSWLNEGLASYWEDTTLRSDLKKRPNSSKAVSLHRAFAPAYVGLAFYYARTDSTLQRPLAMARAGSINDTSSAVNRLLVARVLHKMEDHEEARDSAAAARLSIWSRNANAGNQVCWFGSLTGFANDVIEACDFTVEQYPDSPAFVDSRGLARARRRLRGCDSGLQVLRQRARQTPGRYGRSDELD